VFHWIDAIVSAHIDDIVETNSTFILLALNRYMMVSKSSSNPSLLCNA
jgi:hypothetical protein